MISNEYSSIVAAIKKHAEENPNKLCIADGKTEMTYGEFWCAIEAFAELLNSKGIKNNQAVLVECNQSVEYMICEFALQLAGAVFVPLEKNAAHARVIEIAEDTKAVMHISNKRIEELTDIEHLDIATVASCICSKDEHQWNMPAYEDVAEILFSTGTTGKSKGIVLTHKNDVALAENVKYGTKMKPDNVELIPMPLSHSHGLRRLYGNMLNGSSVIISDGVMLLKKVYNLIEQYNVTAIDLSPTMLSIIFKLGKDSLGEYADQLDYIQLGSAPLPEEDKVHLGELLPSTRLYNFYGSTEAGCSCILDFQTLSGKKGCIGQPTVNASFIVVNEDGEKIESSEDNLGLLASAGDINMREYFNEPELTAQTLKNGYIYTKDLGYIDQDGYVYMLGRKDDVINFGGVKISPEEIETAVKYNPIIKDCACVGIEDKITGQKPKLYIELEDGAEYNDKEFRVFLSNAIDANKQPSIVEVINKIPRTFNGKIIRKELIK